MRVRVRFKKEPSASYIEHIKTQINFFKFLKEQTRNELRKVSKFENETHFIPLNTLNVFEKDYTIHILNLKSLIENKNPEEYIDVYPEPERLMKIKSFEYYVNKGNIVKIKPTPIITAVM